MADQEPGTSQDAEPKQEDANAPINIKVRPTASSVVPCPPVALPSCASGGYNVGVGRSGRPLGCGLGADWFRFCGTQVTTQNGEEVFFKIKRNTKLSKLQGAYANKVGKDVGSIR